jgi:4-amino-4-deoxy-L-arabinose transferase-like glycosyltransferase
MDYLHQLQWPAMIVTVIAAWLIASQFKHRREVGFWCFLLSNALWIVWGWNDHAHALVVLQIALAILNIRGAYKNEPKPVAKSDA